MAGEYPTLGMGFDFNEIARGKAGVEEMRASVRGLAMEAQEAGRSVSSAVGAQSQIAREGAAAAASAATSEKAATSEISASMAQRVAAARMAAASIGQAWTAAFAAEVTASIRAAGEISSSTAALISTTMAQDRLMAQMHLDTRAQMRRADEVYFDQWNAAAAAAAAEQSALSGFTAEAEANALAVRRGEYTAMYADLLRQAEANAAEQQALAGFTTEAEANALAVRRGEYAAMYADLLRQREAAAAADAAATAEQVQASIAAQMGLERETGAAVANAQAKVALSRADIDQARAAGLTVESLEAERLAVDRLRNSLLELATAKANQASLKANFTGADPTLAAGAAAVGFGPQADAAAASYTVRVKELAEAEAAAAMAGKGLALSNAEVTTSSLLGAGTIRELFVIMREMSRLDFTRMAGSFSRLLQFAGGVGLVLQAIPFIAVAAAIAAFTYEVIKASNEQDHLNNMLALTGNIAGVTAGQIGGMAHQIADATDSSIGKARATLEAAAESGKFTADNIDLATKAVLDLSNRTGESADTILAEFEKAQEGPGKFADMIAEKYGNVITPAQLQHIHLLEDEGKSAEALQTVMENVLGGIESSTQEHLGNIENFWRHLTNTISGALEAMRAWGREQTPDENLAHDTFQLHRVQARMDQAGWFGQFDSGAGQIEGLKAKIAADQKAVDAAQDRAQDEGIAAQARRDAESAAASVRTVDNAAKSQTRAATDIAAYKANIQRMIDGGDTPPSAEQQATDIAYLQKRDAGAPKKPPSHAGADNAVARMRADVAALQSEINNLSADPLSTLSAQILKAGADAAARYSAGKNTAYAATAQLLSQEKEEETLVLRLIQAYAKEAATQQDAMAVAQVTDQARTAAAAAIDAYYTAGATGSAAYVAALQSESDAVLQGQLAAKALQIAQQDGVTSIDQIAQHYLDSMPPQLAATAAVRDHAARLQAAAEASYEAAAALIVYTAAQKGVAAGEAQHSAALENIDDLAKQAAAYRAGTAAVAAYDLEKAKEAALAKISRPLTPQENFDTITFGAADPRVAEQQRAMNDVVAAGQQQQILNQAKLNQAMQDQVRLATMTSAEREVDAQRQALLVDLIKAGVPPAQAYAQAMADTDIALRKSVEDAATLSIKIQDGIRDGFAQTGKLDFSKFIDSLEQSIRKAIYDQLLAKPISIVVNATVNLVTQALQQAMSSVMGNIFGSGSAGGGEGMFGNALNSILNAVGVGNGGGAFKTDVGLDHALADLNIGIGKQTSMLSQVGSILGTAGAGAAIAGVTDAALGLNNKDGLSTLGGAGGALIGSMILPGIGTVIGAVLGAVAGSLLGGKASNDATVYKLDPAGNILAQTSDKSTPQTAAAATSAAQAIAQGEAALRAAGLTLTATVSSIDLGVRDSTHILLSNGQDIETAVGDAAAAAAGALKAVVAGATTSDKTLQALIDKMSAAGDSIQDVANAIQAYQQAQTLVSGYQTQNLQYSDPLAYQLAQLAASQKSRQDQFNQAVSAGYITGDQVNAGQSAIDALNQSEINNALQNFATSTDAAAHALKDFKDAQQQILTFAHGLLTGSLSPLSPKDQLALDQSNYQKQLALAQGGDYTALSTITTTAQQYLTDAQKFFGSSTPYSGIFDQIEADLNALGNQTITDPTVSAIDKATRDLTGAIGAGADAIVAALLRIEGIATVPSPDRPFPGPITVGGTPTPTPTPTPTGGGGGPGLGGGGGPGIDGLITTLLTVGDQIVAATGAAGDRMAGAVSNQTALAGGLLTANP